MKKEIRLNFLIGLQRMGNQFSKGKLTKIHKFGRHWGGLQPDRAEPVFWATRARRPLQEPCSQVLELIFSFIRYPLTFSYFSPAEDVYAKLNATAAETDFVINYQEPFSFNFTCKSYEECK